jgi:phage gpG-like protein
MGDDLVIIRASVRGNVEIERTLTRWARRAGDSAPAMEEIKEYMEEMERRQFATEGASSGRPWAPLQEDTKEQRKDKAGNKILDFSGALRESLTNSDDPNAIRLITPGMVKFGTKLAYADDHQRSYKSKDGSRVPARRPIDPTRRDRYVILKIMNSWITQDVRAHPKLSLRFLRV